MRTTESLVLELLFLEQIFRSRGEFDTADLLKESAERLHDIDKIAEYYRQKAENKKCRN